MAGDIVESVSLIDKFDNPKKEILFKANRLLYHSTLGSRFITRRSI